MLNRWYRNPNRFECLQPQCPIAAGTARRRGANEAETLVGQEEVTQELCPGCTRLRHACDIAVRANTVGVLGFRNSDRALPGKDIAEDQIPWLNAKDSLGSNL